MTTDLLIILILAVIVVAGTFGFLLAVVLKKMEEAAPGRALLVADKAISAYEKLLINQKEVSAASLREATNGLRYMALQKRMASLPAIPQIQVPASVSATVN